jgi:hypothetical protein
MHLKPLIGLPAQESTQSHQVASHFASSHQPPFTFPAFQFYRLALYDSLRQVAVKGIFVTCTVTSQKDFAL